MVRSGGTVKFPETVTVSRDAGALNVIVGILSGVLLFDA